MVTVERRCGVESATPRVFPPSFGVRQELIDKSSEIDDSPHDASSVVVSHGATEVLVGHVVTSATLAPQLGDRARFDEPKHSVVASHPLDDTRAVSVVSQDLQQELPQLTLTLTTTTHSTCNIQPVIR